MTNLTIYRITVSSSGTFSTTVSARNALAIHTGATTSKSSGSPSSTASTPVSTGGAITVNFAETATTVFGEVSLSTKLLELII